MAEYIVEPNFIESYEYQLSFYTKNTGSVRYGFSCNAQGVVNLNNLKPAALENYNKAKNDDSLYSHVSKIDCSYYDKGTIKCNHCGFEVVLECNWANSCKNCCTEYNGGGQELTSRIYWGEETGELFY